MQWSRGVGGGGTGGLDPLKNHKNIGFLSNTGAYPLKITKLPSQHSMMGHHWHISETPFNETPFKWPFVGGPTMGRLLCLDILPPLEHQLKKEKKPFKVGPPLTKLSGSVHDAGLQIRASAYWKIIFLISQPKQMF